jgi:predicted NBD/HSP70 family sugar kinase
MARTNAPQWPVMHAILAQGAGAPTHERLAEVARVDPRTVSNVIRQTRAGRLVLGGRPARLGPGLGLTLGLSLGAESLRGCLVDANGDLQHAVEDEPTSDQLEQPPHQILSRLRSMAVRVLADAVGDDELRARSECRSLRLLGVAVAWPSPMDRAKRPVGRALRDSLWRHRESRSGNVQSLPELLAGSFGPPFTVSRCHALNDVSAAALSVAFDESRARFCEPDSDNWRVALVIRVGGGIGAATIILAPHSSRRLSFIDSRLIEGTNGLAGELGHLPIGRRLIAELNEANPYDELSPISYDWSCSCGRKHHLEAFASGAALVRRLRASGYEIPMERRGLQDTLRSELGPGTDGLHVHAVRDIGRILGRAMTGPILMLDPYSITVTGSLATEHLIEGIRRERDLWANAIDDSVRVDQYGGLNRGFICARGAALAVIRKYVYREFLDGRSRLPQGFNFGSEELSQLQRLH